MRVGVRILRQLLRWVVKLGRWLFDEATVLGAESLAAYLRVRARHFLRRAKTARMPGWWRRRARRWRRAADWIDKRWREVTKALGDIAKLRTKRLRRRLLDKAEAKAVELEDEIRSAPWHSDDEVEP